MRTEGARLGQVAKAKKELMQRYPNPTSPDPTPSNLGEQNTTHVHTVIYRQTMKETED